MRVDTRVLPSGHNSKRWLCQDEVCLQNPCVTVPLGGSHMQWGCGIFEKKCYQPCFHAFVSTSNVHSYVCLSRCMRLGLAVVTVGGKGSKESGRSDGQGNGSLNSQACTASSRDAPSTGMAVILHYSDRMQSVLFILSIWIAKKICGGKSDGDGDK